MIVWKQKYFSVFLLKFLVFLRELYSYFINPYSVQCTPRYTYFMDRVSHPLMNVSLAVATWTQLWWGFQAPAVNFGCPLPSIVAEEISWRNKYKKFKNYNFLENAITITLLLKKNIKISGCSEIIKWKQIFYSFF